MSRWQMCCTCEGQTLSRAGCIAVRLIKYYRCSYEMQVSPMARGSGLGKILVQQCQRIASVTKMEKIMLTCLKGEPVRSIYGMDMAILTSCSTS